MRWDLWSVFSPSQLIGYAIVVGAALLLAGRGRAGRWLCVAGALGLLLFGVLPLSHPLVDALERRFAATPLPSQVSGILLLAGSERAIATEVHGEPQLNRHATRYATAQRLAMRYPRARLVFVGGPFTDPLTGRLGEAAVARLLLDSGGIDAARVSFETRATDTCDSAIRARERVRPAPGESWVLVTSAVHMPRAVACFRAAGWDVIPQAADRQVVLGEWGPGGFRVAENLALLDVALHEWVGLAYYRATGRTRTLFPAP